MAEVSAPKSGLVEAEEGPAGEPSSGLLRATWLTGLSRACLHMSGDLGTQWN